MEEQVLLYGHLTPQGQREVDHFVDAHPEYADLLAESKAFSALLHQAHLFQEAPPGDEALAYYLLSHHLQHHPAPPVLQLLFEQYDARRLADPALRARCDALQVRLAALEASSDAVTQFEGLTGHRLRPVGEAGPDGGSLPANGDRTLSPAGHLPRQATARAAVPPRRRLRVVWVSAALAACVVFYGVLWLAAPLTQPDLHRLAAFEADDFEGASLRLRSGSGVASMPETALLYQQAIGMLQQARVTTLGLFPRPDAARLGTAAALLERVVAREPAGTPLHLDALFLLGKVRLLQDDVPAAVQALQDVADQPDGRALEAQALLEALQAHERD